jgi:hypothetical protein
MSFLKETNYRGGRTYDGEGAQNSVDYFRLRVSLTIAWVRLKIEKLLHLRAAPSPISSHVHLGGKHFTVLGSRRRPLPARRPISDIFPISSSNDRPRRK